MEYLIRSDCAAQEGTRCVFEREKKMKEEHEGGLRRQGGIEYETALVSCASRNDGHSAESS